MTYKISIRLNRDAPAGKYLNRAIADGDNTEPSSGQGSTVVRHSPVVSSPV